MQDPWAVRPCLLALHLQASQPCAAKWAVSETSVKGRVSPNRQRSGRKPPRLIDLMRNRLEQTRPSRRPLNRCASPRRSPMPGFARAATPSGDRGRPGRRERQGADHAGATSSPPSDKIMVDGKPLPQAEAPRLWRYHKPSGLVTSHKDPQGRPTVFEALPQELAARRLGRPARHQHRGAAAAHQRRRACAPSRAAEHRLAQALPRARPRPVTQDALDALKRRHHHRRRALRAGRGADRPRARQQSVAHARASRGQEPRGEAACRASRPRREPADPRLLRAVRARRYRRGRGRAR